MKNIHVVPTDKPSRLYVDSQNNICITDVEMKSGNKQHIYITSDEEIKEGDWIFSLKTNNIFKADSIEYLKSHNMIEDFNKSFYINSKSAKKIILTTDQDLINDDVQAVDDEFLEWFVKNPSCESVGVNHFGTCCGNQLVSQCIDCKTYNPDYRIIIPQEESKQEIIEEAERMYNEDDLRNAYRWGTTVNHGTKKHFKEWFEQFKKSNQQINK